MRIGALAGLTLLLGSCVMFPVERTYYEPDSADGKLTRSESCTWSRTKFDAVERYIDGTYSTLIVYPSYKEGGPLRIRVVIRGSNDIDVDPGKVQLYLSSTNAAVGPENVQLLQTPAYRRVVAYSFPTSPRDEEITLSFLPGFLVLDHKPTPLAPFRFRKVTKVDLYYGSINC